MLVKKTTHSILNFSYFFLKFSSKFFIVIKILNIFLNFCIFFSAYMSWLLAPLLLFSWFPFAACCWYCCCFAVAAHFMFTSERTLTFYSLSLCLSLSLLLPLLCWKVILLLLFFCRVCFWNM